MMGQDLSLPCVLRTGAFSKKEQNGLNKTLMADFTFVTMII